MYISRMTRCAINEAISKFELNCKGPLQLSTEWFALREKGSRKRGRIGGSDIASLLGCNPYRSRKQLMLDKQGLKKKQLGNMFAMNFGTIFEEVAVSCFEDVYNTKIMCKNISIVDPQGYDCMIYSPDGVCALPVHRNGTVCIDYDDKNYDKINRFVPVLIEIKCPSSRSLTTDGNVPKYYYPQMQAGMLAIDIVQAAVFIDNQFRVCSYQQLFTDSEYSNEHNYSIHFKSGQVDNDVPMYRGAILLYGKLPDDIDTKYLRKENIGGKRVYDIGNSTFRTFTNILGHMRDNKIKYEYLSPCDTVDDLDIVTKVSESTDDIISIISWKLFDVTYTLVPKDMEYIDTIIQEITKYSDGYYDVPDEEVEAIVAKPLPQNIPVPTITFDDSDD